MLVVRRARGPRHVGQRPARSQHRQHQHRQEGWQGKGGVERLAHRACNTKKGAVKPVVPWSDRLFVVDPAPIIGVVEQLTRKGGRVAVARCPEKSDAEDASEWLLDRLSRLEPGVRFDTRIEQAGGGYLLVLTT